MTTHYYKRCVHCQDVYAYQGSGHGCESAINDEKYCPNCMSIIYAVLKSVPVKYKKIYQGVTSEEMTPEKYLAAREERFKTAILPIVKIGFGRTVFETGEHEIIDFEVIDGKEYMYKRWSNKREPDVIQVAMAKNIKTGEIEDFWRML